MNENWNISGLIIDGICGTGKTTIFRALLQSERFVRKSFLSAFVLSEHHTQRVLERKEREQGLTSQDNISLLDQHVSYLEALHRRLDRMDWCRNNRTNMRVTYVFERFHFTHVYHYPHMSWEEVEEIDRRLAMLNCKLCLLTISDSALEQRIIRNRPPAWRDYLKRYGETDEEILKYYATQQNLLRDLCGKSALETLILDTTHLSADETLARVLDFWNAV